MHKLFKVDLYWGRGYGIESLFIATQDEVNDLLYKEIHFGEICGKHSEVSHKFTNGEIVPLEVSENTVNELLETVGSHISGQDIIGTYADMVEDGCFDEEDE